ncbi:MAG TPA: rhamnogalacturonan acetylesterase [Vicinamibacterales bacterium]|nr:rhamnogalacturonan acetylesterase [Vicinamibacterales bacterium]
MRLLAAMLMAALLAPSTEPDWASAQAQAEAIMAIKVILIGDSTMQAGSGWGGSFCAHHLTSFAACVNLARGGRSSSSYVAEGSWQLALNEMSTPGFSATYVLIQFGHNDQPGKPGRSTDLATEFPGNMTRYVRETRAKGATPILVTPLTRRQFKDGKLTNDLVPWADAIKKVGAETRTPVMDLNTDSAAAVQALGPVLSARFAQLSPSPEIAAALQTGTTIAAAPAPTPSATPAPATMDSLGDPKLAFDYTHLGREGADVFSAMVTRELIAGVPALRRFLIP